MRNYLAFLAVVCLVGLVAAATISTYGTAKTNTVYPLINGTPMQTFLNGSGNVQVNQSDFSKLFYASGWYYSQPLILNRTAVQNVTGINFSWFENTTANATSGTMPVNTNITMALRTKSYWFNDSNLLAWWDLGDSTFNETLMNQSADLSGNSRNLIFTNASQYPVVNTTNGVMGNSLQFDGQNASAEVSTGGILWWSGNYSVSMWINGNCSLPGPRGIFSSGSGTANRNGIICSSNTITAGYYNGGYVGRSYNIQNNVWTHIVYMSMNGTPNIFVNGTNASIYGTSMSTLDVAGLTIGRGYVSAGGVNFNGSIDSVRIYNRTLTTTEISRAYNSGCPSCSGSIERNWSLSGRVVTQPFDKHITNGTVLSKKYAFNASNLIGWWDLGDSSNNETAANASLDWSPYNRTITFGNTSIDTMPVVVANGRVGKALQFNSTQMSYLTLAGTEAETLDGGNFTIGVWVNVPAAMSGYVISKEALANSGCSIVMFNTVPGFTCKGGSGTTQYSRNALTGGSYGAWEHIVVTGRISSSSTDDNDVTWYVNGVESSDTQTKTGAVPINLSVPWGIGYRGGGVGTKQNWFNGTIDSYRIYNRSMTASEVAAFYNGGCPTCANGEDSNVTVWTTSDYSVNQTTLNVQGNIVQYRARFTGTNQTWSPVLQNVTINYTTMSSLSVFACQNLDQPNTLYTMSSNISVSQPNCLTVAAQNVTLDCGGWTLDGMNQTSNLVNIQQNYTQIRGCTFTNASSGVYSVARGLSGVNITNNTFRNNSISLYLAVVTNGTNNTIYNNSFTQQANQNSWQLLQISQSNVYGNNITGTSGSQMYFQSSSNNLIANNTCTVTTGLCVHIFSTAYNNTVSGNNLYATSGSTIELQNGANNTLVHNNNITVTSGNGIYITAVAATPISGTTVTGNTISVTSGRGLHLYSFAWNNVLSFNNVTTNTTTGFAAINVKSAWNNTFFNNRFNALAAGYCIGAGYFDTEATYSNNSAVFTNDTFNCVNCKASVFVNQSSNVTVINATGLNNSNYTVGQYAFPENPNWLNISYFVQVKVAGNYGPAPLALVNTTNSSGTVVSNVTTGLNGITPWFLVNWFYGNATQGNLNNPYTFTADGTTPFGTNTTTISGSTYIYMLTLSPYLMTFTPQGDILLHDYYRIYNAKSISTNLITATGGYYPITWNNLTSVPAYLDNTSAANLYTAKYASINTSNLTNPNGGRHGYENGNITVQNDLLVKGSGNFTKSIKVPILPTAAACAGEVTLVAGGAVPVTTCASTTSMIFVNSVTDGGTVGSLRTATRAAGWFYINSSNAGDTSVVDWFIVNGNA